MIETIIGLGNKGINFKNTRHNIGFYFIDIFSYLFKKKLVYNKNILGYYTYLNFYNKNIILYKPDSYMNEIGKNILQFVKFFNININNIVIIYDDINFLPGISRLKYKGDSFTHNGIKNTILNLKSNNFYKIRIGIGRPNKHDKLCKFVISKPKNHDLKLINKSILRSIICIKKIVQFNNFNIGMNYLNKY